MGLALVDTDQIPRHNAESKTLAARYDDNSCRPSLGWGRGARDDARSCVLSLAHVFGSITNPTALNNTVAGKSRTRTNTNKWPVPVLLTRNMIG